MIESWHIPRPSLGSVLSTSSIRSDDSNSNTAIGSQQQQQQQHVLNLKRNEGYEHPEISNDFNKNVRSLNDKRKKGTSNIHHNQFYDNSNQYKSNGREFMLAKTHKTGNNIKRGSSSSQGSTDSNNTSHSASSGSMLLTAANLERFIEIQNKKKAQENIANKMENNYNSNITQSISNSNNSTNRNEIILTIESDLDLMKKAKDFDNVSIASSTHFTMVNGEGGPSRKMKEGICSHGRQVTVVILSMSVLFLIGIMGMVYALEMRNREMPQS